MVRNEIEHQPQPSFLHPKAQTVQRLIASKRLMDPIAGDRKTRAADILVLEIRERMLKFASPTCMDSRDLSRFVARLPNAQQPNPIHTGIAPSIEYSIREIIQRGGPTEIRRELG
jgi:hypothetical protein